MRKALEILNILQSKAYELYVEENPLPEWSRPPANSVASHADLAIPISVQEKPIDLPEAVHRSGSLQQQRPKDTQLKPLSSEASADGDTEASGLDDIDLIDLEIQSFVHLSLLLH